MARRRRAVEALLGEAGCEHLVFCGANRFGSAVQWLTGWPVTAEAVGVLTPGQRDALFVQYHNHVPLARRLAADADVAWGGPRRSQRHRGIEEARRARGPCRDDRAVSAEQHAALTAAFGTVASLNKAYVRLRMIKSAEELDWLRIGAHFSDLGMAALRDGLRPGLTERELGDLVERAYVKLGGTNVIHYFGVTPMHDPQIAVPAQFPSTRPSAGRRHRVRRDQRGVLGLSGAGAAQFRARRADAALSRPACGGRRGVRRDRRGAARRRDAARR